MDTIHAIGRRKHSVARVYVKAGKGNIIVNNKNYKEYFPTPLLQYKLEQSQNTISSSTNFDIKVNVFGGGLTGQAEAIQLGIAKALVKMESSLRSSLRQDGFLTSDARRKERKKYGLKKARKASQFSKR